MMSSNAPFAQRIAATNKLTQLSRYLSPGPFALVSDSCAADVASHTRPHHHHLAEISCCQRARTGRSSSRRRSCPHISKPSNPSPSVASQAEPNVRSRTPHTHHPHPHTLICVTRHTDLVRDILFKFSMDSRGLYQSDDAAAKLAGTR